MCLTHCAPLLKILTLSGFKRGNGACIENGDIQNEE